MTKKIFMVGLSDELLLLADYCNQPIKGIIDNKKKGVWKKYNIFPEKEEIIKTLNITNIIIALDNPDLKKKLDIWYRNLDISPASLIADNLDSSIKFETGLIRQYNTVISVNCTIGRCVKINIGATVMHDVKIGNYSTIAPRATLLGRVSIGNNVFIGANATILTDIKIGDNSIIGAGAVVTKDVLPGTIVVGNPARLYKNR
jgi:sugar O-acyltransferase (sialic acid O-acetyltransferase NeuD family)